MGSDISKFKENYGQVYCNTDQSFYNPGDIVTGSVFLNLHN